MSPTDLDPSPWPAWVRHTVSAAMGAGVVLVTVTLWFSDVKANAAKGADLAPRVDTLEKHEAEDRRDAVSLKSLMDEVRSDIKELLRRAR